MDKILFRGLSDVTGTEELLVDKESAITAMVSGKPVRAIWVYGAVFQNEDGSFDILQDLWEPLDPYPVLPETIGMKYDKCDKNGKPIYVGDIIALTTEDGEKITIECKFGTVQRQIYENLVEITGFYFERSNDGRKTFPIVNNYLGKHDCKIWEVIGTIFDVKEEAK